MSGAWFPVFTDKDKIINHKDAIENADIMKSAAFAGMMKQRGVLNNFRFCTSAAHTEEDIQLVIEKADSVLADMANM
ncbi:MAG: hypothetical protein MJB12_05370, partial [Firmicutes bacterium]|nr:hypothetical protein [Bacillota bacterium]